MGSDLSWNLEFTSEVRKTVLWGRAGRSLQNHESKLQPDTQGDVGLNPASANFELCDSGTRPSLSVPQFPHLHEADDNGVVVRVDSNDSMPAITGALL